MGKTIGIKLADGSFSPIIESGEEGSNTLTLTTVRDDQTEVHIDLFSSDDAEMKEAEYVATLQLDQLEPRPAGELDVNFLISIDENDTLSAEITEPKSGSRSVKQIPQISQATATSGMPDFALVEAEKEVEEIKPEEKIEAVEKIMTDLPDFDFDLLETEGTATQTQEAVTPDTPVAEETALDDDEEFSFLDETPTEETLVLPEDIDIDLSSLDFVLSEDEASTAAADTPETPESAAENTLTLSDDDFAFLDDDTTELQNIAEIAEPAPVSEGVPASEVTLENEAEPVSEADPTPEEIEESEIFAPLEEIVEPPEEVVVPEIFVPDDIEPLEESESPKKRGRFTAAVITCIICALLCIGALVVVCFFLPSNSIFGTRTAQISEIIEVTPQVAETPAPPAPAIEDVRIAPVSKDNVALPEEIQLPDPIVPAPPPAPETPDTVHYRLKWGDTLWDIAGRYYNNPWLYRRIAQYNGIKNPSHIVSGTDIIIPPR